MNFKVQRGVLLAALTITGKAIGKSVIPILDNYKFDISKTSCLITGSSLDIFISKTIEVESDVESFQICIPAVKLLSLIKGLPDQPVEVVVEEINEAFKVSVVAASGTYNLSGEDGKDYPAIPAVSTDPLVIDGSKLLNAIGKVTFIIDTNFHNESLRQGLIDFGNGVKVVSTNGRMLSVASVSEESVKEKQLLVSKNALDAITAISPKGDVKLYYTDKNVSIQTNDGIAFLCQVIDGKFPDYNSVIPRDPDKFLIVDAAELSAAIKRVSLFSNRMSNMVIFTFKDGELDISAEDLDFQESAAENVSCAYTGDDFQIGVSGPQVVSFLSKLDTADAYFSFTSQNRAVVLRENEDSESSDIMLTMPLVLNQ
jgi:DNA polymerase-3 subunit beta